MPRIGCTVGGDVIKFENPDNGRFYYIKIEGLSMEIVRGGRKVKITKKVSFEDDNKVSNELMRISKKRIKNGYVVVYSD